MADDQHSHITIAQQFSSGGSYVAQRFVHRMSFVYLDRQDLEQAAQELDISGSELVRREERTQSFWVKLLETFTMGCEDIQSSPPLRLISEDELIAAQHRVLLKPAARGPCVIVERGG